MLSSNDFFDVLADATRRRILALLLAEEELSVAEIAHAIDCSQPKTSRHLAKLRDARITQVRRDRVWKYYRLQPQLPAWAFHLLQVMVQSSELSTRLNSDMIRLSAMADRPESRVLRRPERLSMVEPGVPALSVVAPGEPGRATSR
ncbi:metalloregulator ArsR/SmtB family transcription factor [Chitinivorax sp. PXF-14]|uniref:metalloregulator ArsR/SmtB family transcription factor n=1 Tax=Chitinivorax sp. PXF-14 TaxID=3230488 RepID=UPI0034667D6F